MTPRPGPEQDNPQLTAAGYKIKYRRSGAFSKPSNATHFAIFDPKGNEIIRGSFKPVEKRSIRAREERAYRELAAIDRVKETLRRSRRTSDVPRSSVTPRDYEIRYFKGRKRVPSSRSSRFEVLAPDGRVIVKQKFAPVEIKSAKARLKAANATIDAFEKTRAGKARAPRLPSAQGICYADRFYYSQSYDDYIEARTWTWNFKRAVNLTPDNRPLVADLLFAKTREKFRRILTEKDGEGKLFFLVINHKAKLHGMGPKSGEEVEQEGYSNARARITLDTLDDFLEKFFYTGIPAISKRAYINAIEDYLSRMMSAKFFVTGFTIEMLIKKAKATPKAPAKGRPRTEKKKHVRPKSRQQKPKKAKPSLRPGAPAPRSRKRRTR